jgi:hypothetical protein
MVKDCIRPIKLDMGTASYCKAKEYRKMTVAVMMLSSDEEDGSDSESEDSQDSEGSEDSGSSEESDSEEEESEGEYCHWEKEEIQE